ncbi:MAG: photosystem I reaction center subunit PsaK [Actinomycetota bacterium]
MLTTPLLALIPQTVEWNPVVGLVMVLSNILAIAIAKYTIQHPNVGPSLPSPELFGGFSLGAVLGTVSLGHILGAGFILGLSAAGVL